jgi:hypothetical protein
MYEHMPTINNLVPQMENIAGVQVCHQQINSFHTNPLLKSLKTDQRFNLMHDKSAKHVIHEIVT